MTTSQRELVDRLFAEALVLPREQQTVFLAQSSDDAEVRSEVESLLAFASRPLLGITEAVGSVAGSLAVPDFVGLRVGAYRLTGRIGQGGMGAVYRALRDDDQFQKTVAVKMLRFPDGDPITHQRFLHERQILASLEHPNIARLLDGGAWVPPGGTDPQPYIVMEYVEGVPLTVYCEQEKLTVTQRLGLFRRLCDGLSYAHRQLVVHRDVKPGNILVTADGTPKLLDFGVSKLLSPELTAHTNTLTVAGAAAITPDYASPEQVRGESVSTLTDVYSLGTVLYELSTGRRPHQLTTHDPLEIAREICEREVEPPGINSELDMIVLKAMQTEPARRYQSVEQLSEDIRRYLEGLPIVARPDTLAYRAGKFARRHWLGLAATGVVFVALVGGVGVSTWEARRADTEAATAKAVNEFLQNDLLAQAGASAQSGPNTKPDPHLEVLTALDRAAARIGGKFVKQPLVEASIRQTISGAYKDLGLYRNAQQQMERALELRRRASGEQHRETLVTMTQLAELYWLQGERAKGESLFIKTLDSQRRLLGEEHPDTLITISDLGTVYADTARYAQAESLYALGLRVKRRVLGAENPETLQTMHNLASVYEDEGKLGEAESLYSKVLEVRRHTLGEEHPDTLQTMNNIGAVYWLEGQYARAETLYTKLVAIRRRVLGEQHPDTLETTNNLGMILRDQGKYAEAELLLKKVVDIFIRVQGEGHPETLVGMSNLGSLYLDQGKYSQAEPLLSKVLDVRRRTLGEQHPSTLKSMDKIAGAYAFVGKYSQAESLEARVVELNSRLMGESHPNTLLAMTSLATLYRMQNKYAQAESLYGKTLELQNRALGAEHPNTLATQRELATLYRRKGKYKEAASLLTTLLEADRRVLGPQHVETTSVLLLLGGVRLDQQKYAEAEPMLHETLANYQKTSPAAWQSCDTQSMLGVSLAGQKKYGEAEPLLVAGYRCLVKRQTTIPANSRLVVGLAGERIVRLYHDWEKPAQAANWRKEVRSGTTTGAAIK